MFSVWEASILGVSFSNRISRYFDTYVPKTECRFSVFSVSEAWILGVSFSNRISRYFDTYVPKTERRFSVFSVSQVWILDEASKTKCRFGVGSVTFENSKYREKNDARGVVLASFWRGKRGHFHLGILKK